MKSLAKLTLGIPKTDNSTIRIPYGASSVTGTSPMHDPKNSVCYVYVSPTDDGYGQKHHLKYINGENGKNIKNENKENSESIKNAKNDNNNENENKNKENTNNNNPNEYMIEVDEYTEVYSVIFSFYGGDAYDKARKLRDGIFGVAVKEFLQGKHIYPKTAIPPIIQTHEVLNTMWIKRCDITVMFYAFVRIERETSIFNIEQVNINLKV